MSSLCKDTGIDDTTINISPTTANGICNLIDTIESMILFNDDCNTRRFKRNSNVLMENWYQAVIKCVWHESSQLFFEQAFESGLGLDMAQNYRNINNKNNDNSEINMNKENDENKALIFDNLSLALQHFNIKQQSIHQPGARKTVTTKRIKKIPLEVCLILLNVLFLLSRKKDVDVDSAADDDDDEILLRPRM